MFYKLSSVKALPNGTYKGVIVDAKEYNNPNGNDKAIIDIQNENGVIFTQFFTPGFAVFEQLLKLVEDEPKVMGNIDLKLFIGIPVEYTTEITTVNDNDYCNVTSIKKTSETKKMIDNETGEVKVGAKEEMTDEEIEKVFEKKN